MLDEDWQDFLVIAAAALSSITVFFKFIIKKYAILKLEKAL